MITDTKLLDMVSTSTLLNQTNMMSVNQLNCQIKIQEIWKALNVPDYPIQLAKQSINDIGTATRASTTGRLIESGKSCLSQTTCLNDAIRLRNTLPLSVTKCDTFSQIKRFSQYLNDKVAHLKVRSTDISNSTPTL